MTSRTGIEQGDSSVRMVEVYETVFCVVREQSKCHAE